MARKSWVRGRSPHAAAVLCGAGSLDARPEISPSEERAGRPGRQLSSVGFQSLPSPSENVSRGEEGPQSTPCARGSAVRGDSLAAPPENFSKSLSMLTSQPDREAEGACPGPVHSPDGAQGLGEVFSGCLGPPSCTGERRGLLNQGRRIGLSRVRGGWGRHPGLATGIQEVTADSRTS